MDLVGKIVPYLKGKRADYFTKKSLDKIWKDTSNSCKLKKLSKSQISDIQKYWYDRTGKKVLTKWHQLLYSLTGEFKVEYEPFEVCIEVQQYLSPALQQYIFDDKGLYRSLLNGYNIPTRVAECNNGIYYLPNQEGPCEIEKESFLKKLENVDNCIIKPSKGTDGGRGVCSFSVTDGIVDNSQVKLDEYIRKYEAMYGLNYCIESKIDECENLSCLNPSSCNSLRIHTFRNRQTQKIEFLSSYVRIGKKGNVVDNAYSGGFCAPVYPGGLLKKAITVYPYKTYKYTESGIYLENYCIDNFQNMVDTVLKAHSSLPMFDLIGWDVAMDKNGNVIIIEFNPNPDVRMEQVIFGTTCLANKQDEVLKQVYQKRGK